MKTTGYVYQIRNLITGECYIGKTLKDPQKRFREHLNSTVMSNRLVSESMQIYGEAAMLLEILESNVEADRLDQMEIHYIRMFNTLHPHGYNLKAEVPSDEYRRNMSEAQKGKTLTLEHRRKMSASHIGIIPSDETRRKMSNAHKGEKNHNYGKPISEEHRRRISEAHKGKPLSAEHRLKLSEVQRGEKNHFYGKSHSDEARRKMSESQKRRRTKEKQELASKPNK